MKNILFAVIAMVVATTGAWAQSGYQIRPGDVLAVEVVQDPSLNREVLVLPDGTITFPFAGTLPASRRTAGQLAQLITQGIASNFAVEPDVFVTVSQVAEIPELPEDHNMIDIYYLGEFNEPGMVQLPRGSTLLQAMSMGGGFTNFAAERRIQLRRTNRHTGQVSVSIIDFRAISQGAVMTNNPALADGDVILAPERRLFE